MFYKLIDENTLKKFNNPLKTGEEHIFTNSEEVLNANGYYKVVISPKPEEIKENTYLTSKYVLIDNMIHRIWEEHEFEVEEIIETEEIGEEN